MMLSGGHGLKRPFSIDSATEVRCSGQTSAFYRMQQHKLADRVNIVCSIYFKALIDVIFYQYENIVVSKNQLIYHVGCVHDI